MKGLIVLFSYDPLWKLLIDKKMTKTELREAVNFSTFALAKMGKNENISMETLDKICDYLDVPIERVIRFVRDKEGND